MKDKILDRIVRFDILLGLTAVAIALVAAFFSVYGIATLFAGAFALTAFMASTLEIGKLVAVTYLYRYWSKTKKWLAAYLSIATFVLMLITSMGIFGDLSAAYQKSSLAYKTKKNEEMAGCLPFHRYFRPNAHNVYGHLRVSECCLPEIITRIQGGARENYDGRGAEDVSDRQNHPIQVTY